MDEWQIETQKKLTEISKKWADSIRILKRIKIDGKQGAFLFQKITNNVNTSIPAGEEFTLDNLNKKLEPTLHQLQQIIESEHINLLPHNQSNSLNTNLGTLKDNVRQLHTSCENLKKRDKNTECSIDAGMNLTYQLNGEDTLINLTTDMHIFQILDNAEILLGIYSSIAFITNGEISPNFTLYNEAWKNLYNQLSDKLDEAEEEYKTINGEFKNISELYQIVKNAKEYSDIVVANQKIIEKDREGVGEFTQEYNELRDMAKKINGEFSKWDEIKIKMGEVMKKLEEHEEKAGAILDMSDSAKLSENFKTREKRINFNLFLARSFHFVVLLIFIFYSLALFNFLGVFNFLGIFGVFDINTLKFESILVRFTLILPVLLLVGFTNRQYKELFKLKEHYAYKDSIASSIPSFKNQSGDYGELVATTLFSKLTFNPADDIGKKKDKSDYVDEPESLYKTAIDAIKKKITNKEELSYKTAIDAIEKEIASKRKSSYKEIFEAIEAEIAIIEGLADKNDTTGQAAFDAIKKIIADKKATDAQENN